MNQIEDGMPLVQLINKLDDTIKDTKYAIKMAEEENTKAIESQKIHPNLNDGFTGGYYGRFSRHTDDSGYSIDLCGCYCELDALKAVLGVLEAKKEWALTKLDAI